MRRNYNRAYLHFIWATWDRLPALTPDVRDLVYPVILAECAKQNCRVEALGGVANHVHLVVHFSATASIAGLMKAVKGASSHLVTQKMPSHFFKWQGAYGVESVEPEGLPAVIQYVQDQEKHHRDHRLETRWETIDIDNE
jgi:putative transposase